MNKPSLTLKDQSILKMPRLTNAEFDRADNLANKLGIPLDRCPVCLTKPEVIDQDNYREPDGATYRFRGETLPCDCERFKTLRKHYLVANIPDEYQRLNWKDFTGSQSVKDGVESYLDAWPWCRLNGMGLEFYGKKLGTGKTFCATHVGKELIKQGERVFFIRFKETLSVFENEGREEMEDRLKNTPVLLLDEVVPPWSEAQNRFFADRIEELIRHRTGFNLPTIMTTNIEPQELREMYPRSYSLLEAKQMRVEITGSDARQGVVADENLELVINREVRPIT